MSMSDCPECWDTPYTCGHMYKDRGSQYITKLIKVLNQVLRSKLEEENKTSLGVPRIVCAANRFEPYIVVSARHFDLLMHAQIASLPITIPPGKWEQGFIDQFGNFLTREEAWIIAEKNGQIINDVSSPGKLYSENLY